MTNIKKELTQELVRELFDYNELTGELIRKIDVGKTKIGQVSGCLSKGYYYTIINKKRYSNHRIIFLWYFGYIPDIIDHIDRCTTNNRVENLRPATKSQNNQNTDLQSNNTTGVRGVDFSKQKNKFRVRIKLDGKEKHLGFYNTIEEARVAREAGELKYFTHSPLHNK